MMPPARSFKHTVQGWLNVLGERSPRLARLLLFAVRTLPHLYVFVARSTRLEETASRRVWTIVAGPLSGRKLTGLMPDEIWPVLANTMEIHCSSLLANLALEKATVLDVGASYGYYSLLCSRLVGDRGHVYSFEADAQSFSRLLRNLQMNHVRNVTAVATCVANTSGFSQWVSDNRQPWLSRRVAKPTAQGSLQVVPVITLDAFSDSVDILHKVRLVKIDVEGAELDVLEGMRQLIRASRPAILCELHGAPIADQVFAFLRNVGYLWKIVEHASEERQHILALSAGEAVNWDEKAPFQSEALSGPDHLGGRILDSR